MCDKRSITSRVWMDCDPMAGDGKGVGRRRDARNQVLQICVAKACTCGGRVAETDGELDRLHHHAIR